MWRHPIRTMENSVSGNSRTSNHLNDRYLMHTGSQLFLFPPNLCCSAMVSDILVVAVSYDKKSGVDCCSAKWCFRPYSDHGRSADTIYAIGHARCSMLSAVRGRSCRVRCSLMPFLHHKVQIGVSVITARFGVLLAGFSLFLSLLSSTVFAEKDVSLADAASREAVAAAETIRELAMIESGSNDLEGLKTIADNLDARLVKLGFQTERYTSPVDVGADSVVGMVKGTGTQRVMLMAHMDTVFERGILDSMPVRQEENKLFGPGVLDAKGGIAVILHSLSILADRGWRDYETLTVLFNPDEEIGSAGSGALISKFASQSDTVLSFEVGGDGARGMA